MPMNCRCGSGRRRERCHGDTPDAELRRVLLDKYVTNATEKRLETYRHFTSETYPQRKAQLRARILIATTPAGVIHYPVGLIHEGRFLRPMSIDGVSYNEGWVSVEMMLTPTIRAFIYFRDKKDPNGLWTLGAYELEVEAFLDGDPFGSLFALPTEGTKVCFFHHTTQTGAKGIDGTLRFLPSKWNFQGMTELVSPHHAYFTSVAKLIGPSDMLEVGMAPEGTIAGLITDDGHVFKHEVYRLSPKDRAYTIKVLVDWSLIAPNPLVLHDPRSNVVAGAGGPFSWWEVFHPAIFRVPIRPGGSLKLTRRGKRQYELKRTPDFIEPSGFYAALGTDIPRMYRMWTETSPTEEEANRPSDVGLPDSEWKKVAAMSLSHLVGRKMMAALDGS
nr:SEC-C domain-containing protein [Myxococcus sp. MH1]